MVPHRCLFHILEQGAGCPVVQHQAYARVWACNSTPEYTAMLVNSDVHSPARLRVMAALPMIDTWYEAFGILPTDKMFIPKEKRALVW